jgi:hypothetical protein
MPAFLVATITKTPSRAEEPGKDLHPIIPHANWRQAYLFSALEDLTPAALLPKAATVTA